MVWAGLAARTPAAPARGTAPEFVRRSFSPRAIRTTGPTLGTRGRPRFDIRDLFGSHKRACEQADRLLFAIAEADRVKEACRAAPVGKIHTDQPAVSYLDYPDFDTDPHPALRSGYIVRLDSLRADYRDYSRHTNPPILHRKETFIAADDPRRAKFERLTKQELRAGLYADPAQIGTRAGWSALLNDCGVELRGHALRRRR